MSTSPLGPDAHVVSPGLDAAYLPGFIGRDDAVAFAQVLRQLDWRRERLRIFGRSVEAPRLSAWYGEPGTTYRYSGAEHAALRWTPELADIRRRIQEKLVGKACFNFVLANLYRDGCDTIGWHADNERELGAEPLIASVSFGATRRFVLRRRDRSAEASIELEHGSLLVMWGRSQREWVHALPRMRRLQAPRINLTYRSVLA